MARRKKLCCLAALCLAAAATRSAPADTIVKVSAPTPVVQATAQNFAAPPPTMISSPAPAAMPTGPSAPTVVSQTVVGSPMVVSGPTVVEGSTVVGGPITDTINGVSHALDYDWVGMSYRAPAYRVWATADFMLSTLRGTQVPPLVTTSPNNVARGNAAVLGSNSDIVFGGGNIDTNTQSGARVFFGGWFNERRGFEIGGFMLGERTVNGGASGTGLADSIAVGRPFIETNTGTPTAALSAFKDQLTGSSSASLTTNLWGAEANLLTRESFSEILHVTLLAGLRYADLEQRIDAQDFSTPQPGSTIPFAGQLAITAPNAVRVIDTFRVRDQFIGGQIGVRGAVDVGRLELGASGKLALGATYQTLHVSGASEVLASNGQVIVNSPGGLLANSGNIGSYSRNVASVIPELELKVGYRLTNNFTCHVSYSFLYWDNVALAGGQIPRNVDLTKVPTSATFNQNIGASASSPIVHSDFYMNTIFFGGTLKY